jgi:glycerol-3-phosphate acyltransferase PlsY
VFFAWLATRGQPVETQAALTALAGGSAFFGHLFPVWLGFKGGKGVATFFGTLLAAAWPVGIAAGATWILMALVFRISSLSALTAALLAPLFVLLFGRPPAIAVLAVVMGVLIYIRHAPNIGRLLKGEEPRIGGKKPPAEAA